MEGAVIVQGGLCMFRGTLNLDLKLLSPVSFRRNFASLRDVRIFLNNFMNLKFIEIYRIHPILSFISNSSFDYSTFQKGSLK